MALSIGRTIYNLTGRREPGADASRPVRPLGQVVWLHASEAVALAGVLQLARRLAADLDVSVLITSHKALGIKVPAMIEQRPPLDSATDAKVFLDHWQPDLIVMTEGEVRPAALLEAADRKIAVLMVDARTPYLIKGRDGWYPGLLRRCLQTVRQVLTVDESATRTFRKAGALNVATAGRLEEGSAALAYHEPERAALAELFATRPVWLAADVPAAEEAAVIAAHRSALRLAHRLLLIFVPQDPSRAPQIAAQMEASEGWMVAQRGLEQEPEADTEVYIPDAASEYGIWYRLAPVTFMGGTLQGDGCARNPMEPAALGSAILYGPRPGAFGTVFGRLGAALAARAVGSPTDLGDALADLLSPDRAARLAAAAWTVASDGVDVTNRVIDLSRRILAGEA
jgi:3-deoxy-D-manno-octulosonic-acid transferase